MKLFRHLASVGVGLLAGAAAYELMKKYNRERTVEGEYLITDPESTETLTPDAAEAAAAEVPVQRTEPTPLSEEDAVWDLPTADDVFKGRGQTTSAEVNPVDLGTAEKPPMVEGKVDPAKIADPRDFADWDSFGCRG